MKNKFSKSSSRGIGFTGLLAIVFIILKLLGITAIAEWSWLWVLAPIWIPFAIVIALVIIIVIIVIFSD